MLHRSQLASLGDEALLQSLKAVAARSNQITAALLAHLAEVDARGAHRLWACPTLQAYCVYELRLSEDEAQRRCRAARLARRFPRLLDMLADSSLHLTGLLLVGPHLSPENANELLARVAFRTKREIERVLAEVAPRPDVPSLVEPLGPARDGCIPRAPKSWAAFVRGVAGFERKLPRGVGPGEAPAIPADESHERAVTVDGAAVSATSAVDATSASDAGATSAGDATSEFEGSGGAPGAAGDAASATSSIGALHEAVATGEATRFSSPKRVSHETDPGAASASRALRYRIQFTADQEFVDRLSEARDLLWHQLPNGDLASIHRLALEALVTQLRRRKFAATRNSRAEGAAPARSCLLPPQPAPTKPNPEAPAPARASHLPAKGTSARSNATGLGGSTETASNASTAPPRSCRLPPQPAPTRPNPEARAAARASDPPAQPNHPAPARSSPVRAQPATATHNPDAPAPENPTGPMAPARESRMSAAVDPCAPGRAASAPETYAARTARASPPPRLAPRRHLPAAIRREVWQRDGGRCTFVDARGVRCPSTAALEFHHEWAHALGGPSTEGNLALRCRAHNRLAAERDFGAEHLAARTARARCEP